MMRAALKIFPWFLLALSFALPAYFYDSIIGEILIYRNFFGGESLFAPKSFFAVFRVPLIESVCGAMVETMRQKFARSDESGQKAVASMWDILLYTVAFKSLFQTLEFIVSSVYQSPAYAEAFFYATIFAVGVGIISVAVKSPEIFRNFRRENWKVSPAEKMILVVLLVSYLFLAFAPSLIYKSF